MFVLSKNPFVISDAHDKITKKVNKRYTEFNVMEAAALTNTLNTAHWDLKKSRFNFACGGCF